MSDRRVFLRSAAAGLTTNLFPRMARGANGKVRAGFIGIGRMGTANMRAAMQNDGIEIAAVCDVYEPHLKRAVAATKGQAKGYRDFREVLADRSIDVVCVSTPDHWHAYMTVEACKAGKDVYVEKPISVTIEEGQLMVKAARKYNRVVQAGTQQRSQVHFQKAAELVRSGVLGDVTFVKTWNYANNSPEGEGNPPDAPVPDGLDWDMWLGPAPKRPFNTNRWGIGDRWSTFRYFWDYAGGWMTDWAIHLLDIVQMAYGEQMPRSVTALGERYFLKDNTETPDTLSVTYTYPNFLAVYENRQGNANSLINQGYGILFHGRRGTLFVDRAVMRVIPERGVSDLEPREVKMSNYGNREHWANFLDCVKTRKRPVSDVETCHRTSTTCHLANIALRSKLRVDFDPATERIAQAEARRYVSRTNRAPWRIAL